MRAAHLVRLTGDVVGTSLEEARAELLGVVESTHDPSCAALCVDLSEVTALPAEATAMLVEVYAACRVHHLTLSLTAPRGTPANRVLEFHRAWGVRLPPILSETLDQPTELPD